MKIALITSALLLAGCVDMNDTPVNTRPAPLTGQDRGYVQAVVLDELKDPGTAQLRNLRSFDLSNDQGRVICGDVNGKNSFGGYVGFQPFYIRLKNGIAVSQHVGSASQPYSGQFAVEACAEAASGQMTVNGQV